MKTRFDRIILASASPRRRELLEQIGVRFEVLSQAVDESLCPGEAALEYVSRLALQKARAVLDGGAAARQLPVLGADTAVVCGGQILGKPGDREEALRMLLSLSGRSHQVHTGVALICGDEQRVAVSTTTVTFRSLTPEECHCYWLSGEPQGKAGAYAIQGLAAQFVSALSGSYSGVVGLPLYETAQLLEHFQVSTGLSHTRVSGDTA